MKPPWYHAGSILIGVGDAVQTLGEVLVEVGYLLRQGLRLDGAGGPPPVAVRKARRVPPRHAAHSNGELSQ